MKFVIKYFSEITIKSKPVRRRIVGQLADNLRFVLGAIDPDVVVLKQWDRIQIETQVSDKAELESLLEAMRNTSGITYILQVREHALCPVEDMVAHILPIYAERLAGKTFAVRCKRTGKHNFRSIDVERQLGADLLAQTSVAGVKLKHPEVTVELEIYDQRYLLTPGKSLKDAQRLATDGP